MRQCLVSVFDYFHETLHHSNPIIMIAMYIQITALKFFVMFDKNYQVIGKDENDVRLCRLRRLRNEKGKNDDYDQHCNYQRDEAGYYSISCYDCFVFHLHSIC